MIVVCSKRLTSSWQGTLMVINTVGHPAELANKLEQDVQWQPSE